VLSAVAAHADKGTIPRAIFPGSSRRLPRRRAHHGTKNSEKQSENEKFQRPISCALCVIATTDRHLVSALTQRLAR
jgi:hypothetical protein